MLADLIEDFFASQGISQGVCVGTTAFETSSTDNFGPFANIQSNQYHLLGGSLPLLVQGNT